MTLSILGRCQTIPAITGTLVTPLIGFIKEDIGNLNIFKHNPEEVDHIFVRSLGEHRLLLDIKDILHIYCHVSYRMILPFYVGLCALIVYIYIDELLEPSNRSTEQLTRGPFIMDVPVFGTAGDPERIWGLTAMILSAVIDNAIIPSANIIERESSKL